VPCARPGRPEAAIIRLTPGTRAGQGFWRRFTLDKNIFHRSKFFFQIFFSTRFLLKSTGRCLKKSVAAYRTFIQFCDRTARQIDF
jgi:hypothetical protein